MLSESQANFFIHQEDIVEQRLLNTAFKNNSYEIFQFLTEEDISNLKLTNKFFNDICECHQLLGGSLKSLGKLFSISIDEKKEPTQEKKKSKFKEKYNFNKPIGEYYKPKNDSYFQRIQSAKRGFKKK